MDKKKVMYIGIILLVTVITSITYFSYAFFTKKDEYHGRLNIVAGELKYRIESADLENNSITLEANTTKEIEVEITSLNDINSEYSLYYDNSNIEIGYKEDSTDLPSGSINNSGKKKVTLIIKNKTSSSQTVTFGVKGGFSGKTISLSNGENSVDQILGVCSVVGTMWTFDYTGDVQSFDVPCDGIYKLEIWGAQGGIDKTSSNNYGGYSTGNVGLLSDSELYIYVGGQGQSYASGSTISYGGYNGGGNGGTGEQGGSGGGGATHIATTNRGVLSNYNQYRGELLIVSGGGGGNTSENVQAGAGGGYIGNNGGYNPRFPQYHATGGTQTEGGIDNAEGTTRAPFGQGGAYFNQFGGNGGGGGYYGGGGSSRSHSGAGGGSGYIGNSLLMDKYMACYNCNTSNDINTKTISNTCHNSTATDDCAKEENGYARITYLAPATKVTLYSAAVDEVYYYNSNNQKVVLGTTNSAGKLENVFVPNGVTLYSSVAKDPDNLSNPFTKTVNNIENDFYLMPDGKIVYWYGYKYADFDVIKNVCAGRTTYTYTSSMLPQFETNRIVTNYPSISANTRRFAGIASSTPIDITNYSYYNSVYSSSLGHSGHARTGIETNFSYTGLVYPGITSQQYANNDLSQLYLGMSMMYTTSSTSWGGSDTLTELFYRVVQTSSFGAWTSYTHALWLD